MTYQDHCTVPTELLEQIAADGFDALPDLIRILFDAAMRVERQQYLGARPYERSPARRGRANGFKPKTISTRMGEITCAVPQVREGGFYPEALEKGLRSERALTSALAEMYVQGVSTRKVKAITEQLCGTSVSSSQVSRATALLDETLQAWRNRPLGEIAYLYLDARYEKVRQDGQIRDAAILIACGVDRQGRRQILGVSVSLSESDVHWRSLLQRLVARGLGGVQFITHTPALRLVSAVIMLILGQLAGPPLVALPGNAVSSTYRRTPGPMCPAGKCSARWQMIFAPCSKRPTSPRLRNTWPRWCKSVNSPPHVWRTGWKRTCRRA